MPDLRSAWLGTAGVYLASGATALLIDGFFTRPSLAQVAFARLAPDPRRVAAGLERAGIDRLAAVLVSHTHYDHALDAPLIAGLTGAVLAGSSSLANLRGAAGFPPGRFFQADPNHPLDFEPLRVEWIVSRHNNPDRAPGEVPSHVRLPARALAYRGGTTYALRIHTPAGILGVMGSAGYVPGMFTGKPVDALFLSAAGLSRLPAAFREDYYQQTILAAQAKTVIPIHWDNFFQPLSANSAALPPLLDDSRRTLRQMQDFCSAHGVMFQIPAPFERLNPFDP
jgi:L-ascorbate metabolism protein UlaG (beta-lactamase superfamily)